MAASTEERPGVYCATAGTTFHARAELQNHYRSDLHRYNLKRKIAGLPPVTQEWFEARKGQLLASEAAPVTQSWLDPLTRKRFGSENTYLAHVNSRKYKELVAKSGEPAPAPVVSLRQHQEPAAGEEPAPAPKTPAPYTLKAANGVEDHTRRDKGADGEEGDEDEGWETASDEDEAAPGSQGASARRASGQEGAAGDHEMAQAGEDWDVTVSLLDGHKSRSLEANLEYMWRKFGFYFPDAQYLKDPAGLMQYLGAKLQQGGVPLYQSGLSESARSFASLHAVQRHMQDTGRCKMLWEGNEDEYEDYYDYSALDGEAGEGADAPMSTALSTGAASAPQGVPTGGYELAVSGQDRAGAPASGKLLGSREFARFYRQRYRPADTRASVATVQDLVATYQGLGIATVDKPDKLEAKRQQRIQHKIDRLTLNTLMRGNVNRNLPRNCVF